MSAGAKLGMLAQLFQYREPEEEQTDNPRSKTARSLRFDTFDHDPLGKLLVGTLKLNPLGVAALAVLVTGIIYLVAALLYALLSPASLSDWARYVFTKWYVVALSWVVMPAVLAFYPWVTRVSGSLFADLYIAGVVQRDYNEVRNLVCQSPASVKNHICDKRWTYAAIGVALVAVSIWTYTGLVGRDWDITPYIGHGIWLHFVLLIPAALVGNYMLYIVVAREIAIIRGLYRLFNEGRGGDKEVERVNVQPWHPDGCGGLGQLRDYAIRFSYFLAMVAVVLLLFTYISIDDYGFRDSLITDPGMWAGIVAYIVLAPGLFFLTLGSAHRAMLSEKRSHLHQISNQLDREYQNTRANLSADSAVLGASLDKIRRLHDLYDLTVKFPVWPFDLATLRRFGTAVVAPFITVALPVGIERVIQLVI